LRVMPTSRTLATRLVPSAPGLRLDQITIGSVQIVAALIATRPTTPCPLCGCLAQRRHSVYQRTLADLPWGRYAVTLLLIVRKFFCDTRQCPRRIFTERLPELVAPWARRTLRLAEVLAVLAFALGGESGARVVARLGMAVSPATLLRLVRRTPLRQQPTPRVLGVDDWAFRKGHHYGTILVDLQQRRVIELLPERKAEPLIDWLQAHPGVEVVSRDRAPAYAEAARKGAPGVVQVADRWHLLQNLVDALERCLLRFRPTLKRAAGLGEAVIGPLPSPETTVLVPWQQRAEAVSQQKHDATVERYERMRALQAAGFTILDIAQVVGASRRTVYRYLALDGPPERRRPHRSSRGVLAPYEAYWIQRWTEGCRNRSRLFREIRLLGYRHSARTVSLFLQRLEHDPSSSVAGTSGPTVTRVPSARHVASLLIWRKDQLSDEERAYLQRLCDHEPTIARAYELAQAFAVMARERTGQAFEAWLASVAASGIAELQRYASGLVEDRAAVEAGLTQVWSNGQTEGQINKLKLVKRQMYGRAKFDLLRQRVLHAA
jgi:transposase